MKMLIKQRMNVLRDLVARKDKSNQHSFSPFLLLFWKTTSPFGNPLFYSMALTLSSSSLVVPKTKFNRRQKAVIITSLQHGFPLIIATERQEVEIQKKDYEIHFKKNLSISQNDFQLFYCLACKSDLLETNDS